MSHELAPGTLLGGIWLIEHRQASGGFGHLYRARHVGDGRRAAIKVLHRHLVDSSSALRRFAREAETLALLSHPAIVQHWGSGEMTDGRPYLVMEWLEGQDLAAALRRSGPLPPAEAVTLARALASPLSAAHAAGVVHRDLKPENVMLLGDGFEQLKLVDFGVAKLLEREPGASTTDTVLGTPLSMAPEQIQLQAVDARADIYAFGLLLFRVLAGRPAFTGDNSVDLVDQHLYAPAPRLSSLAPVPSSVDHVIARCLEKDAADRFASIDEACAALVSAVSTDRSGEVVAVHLEVVEPDEQDSAGWSALDTMLGSARTALVGAGLSIDLDSGAVLLCTGALQRERIGELEARCRVLLERMRTCGLSATVTLHAGRDADRPGLWLDEAVGVDRLDTEPALRRTVAWQRVAR